MVVASAARTWRGRVPSLLGSSGAASLAPLPLACRVLPAALSHLCVSLYATFRSPFFFPSLPPARAVCIGGSTRGGQAGGQGGGGQGRQEAEVHDRPDDCGEGQAAEVLGFCERKGLLLLLLLLLLPPRDRGERAAPAALPSATRRLPDPPAPPNLSPPRPRPPLAAAQETFLRSNIKVDNKKGNLQAGKKGSVDVVRSGSKVTVESTTTTPFAKRYFKWLTKKYLQKNEVRHLPGLHQADVLRTLALLRAQPPASPPPSPTPPLSSIRSRAAPRLPARRLVHLAEVWVRAEVL